MTYLVVFISHLFIILLVPHNCCSCFLSIVLLHFFIVFYVYINILQLLGVNLDPVCNKKEKLDVANMHAYKHAKLDFFKKQSSFLI